MRALLLATALSMPPAATFAQQERIGWSFGALGAVSQSIYIGTDTSANVLPIIGYRGPNFAVGTDGVTAQISRSETLRTEVFLAPRIFALVTSDAAELNGIDRDITGDVGAKATYSLSPVTSLSFSAQREITGEHDGSEIRLRLSQRLRFGNFPINASVNATWQSADLADYLYGVAPTEVATGRPAYSPGSVVIPSLSLGTGLPLGERTFAFANLSYRVLPDEVTASPLIARDSQLRLGLGLRYNF